MNCKDCPYIKEQFNSRISSYDFNHLLKTGVYSKEEYENEIAMGCWCDKTGGKVWWYSQCSDAHSPIVMSNKVNKKRNNVNFIKHNSKISKKRERDWKHRNHAKKLARITEHGWPPAYYLETKDWFIRDGYIEIIEYKKPYYKRIYRGQRSKWIKNQCNRSVRRYKGKIPNGGSYKKIAEYWWEMY